MIDDEEKKTETEEAAKLRPTDTNNVSDACNKCSSLQAKDYVPGWASSGPGTRLCKECCKFWVPGERP